MSEDKRWKALVGSIALLALITLWGSSRISNLNEEVDRIRGDLSTAGQNNAELRSLQRQIEALKEEQEWASSVNWQYDESDVPPSCNGSLPVTATVALRDQAANEMVRIEARQNNGPWQSFDTAKTDTLTFQAEPELELTDGWEYRIVGESEQGQRASDPTPLEFLRSLVARHPDVHEVERRQVDGEIWSRFLAANRVAERSPCNSVTAVTLEITNDGDVVEMIEMHEEYSDNHGPPSSGTSAPSSGNSQDGAASGWYSTGGKQEIDEWWSDWILLDSGDAVTATFEYSDGESDTIEAYIPRLE